MNEPLVVYQQNLPVATRYVIAPLCPFLTINILTNFSLSPYGIPPSECMIPGETYVGRLPGRTQKAFVRKRPPAESQYYLLRQDPDPSHNTCSLKLHAKMGFLSRARHDGYYVSYGPCTRRPRYICTPEPEIVYKPPPDGRVATTVRQTCASCGKFRSAKWEAAHPLSPGMAATPSICARCQRDKTSSEEKECKHLRKKRRCYHHSRHCTDSTDDSFYSARHSRSPRRYRSDSRDYARPRESSRDNIRIVIANQPGGRAKRESTQSSTTEPIRLVRRTSFIEVPERICSRSKAQSSSRAFYLDDDTTAYFEDIKPPRRRTRSRSLSRLSYVEERAPRRSRHPRRSSTSRVQFVDDADEPVIVSKQPRRITRRRAVYFDGAASFECSKHEERGRSLSRSSHRQPRQLEGVQLTEEAVTMRPSSAERLEETLTSHSRSSSAPAVASITPHRVRKHALRDRYAAASEPLHYKEQATFERPEVHSNQDRTPRPALSSLSLSHWANSARAPNGYKRSHSKAAGSGSSRASMDRRPHSENDIPRRVPHEPATPQNKRRRRYRDDPTKDDRPPLTYRHVRAPSPPSSETHPDYLTEMLRTAHITPPNQQVHRHQARGPPSPPRTRSSSRSRSSSAYQRPFYRDIVSNNATYGPAPYQYSAVEDFYGQEVDGYAFEPAEEQYATYLDHEDERPQATTVPEYDWMF